MIGESRGLVIDEIAAAADEELATDLAEGGGRARGRVVTSAVWSPVRQRGGVSAG